MRNSENAFCGDMIRLPQKDGTERAFRWEFVARFETTPQGGVLLHFIDGGQMSLQADEWKIATASDSPEPQAAANAPAGAGA